MGLVSHDSTISMWWVMNKFIEKAEMLKRPVKLVCAPL
jgi:hypothetical protein